MKKIALFAVALVAISFASCKEKASEVASTVDSGAALVDSAATAVVDSAATVVDSAAAVVDSAAAQL